MAYSEEIVRRAKARLDQAKAEQEAEYEARLSDAYRDNPRLKEIDLELRKLSAQAIAAAFQKSEDPQSAIAALRDRSLELQQQCDWILDAAGYEDGWLDKTPVCELCGGSGYLNGKMCSCLKELCRQEQKKELAAQFLSGEESFDRFRLEYYPDEIDEELGVSPRRIMRATLQSCRQYASSFRPGSESLLFSGATGLGKTFLSACIARQVSDKGYSVIYQTAVDLFADFEAAKFGGGDEDPRAITKKYTDCDLLIIDDLGTELTTQFTISALYTVIDARLRRKLSTIVSTNLTPEAIEDRYSPQIASRLCGSYRLIQFFGTDIRMMK